jgi:hypothetical protein
MGGGGVSSDFWLTPEGGGSYFLVTYRTQIDVLFYFDLLFFLNLTRGMSYYIPLTYRCLG